MPRSSTRNDNSSAADKRRAVFNKVLYKPLPLRKRKWQPINAQCPICLQEDHEEYGLPTSRMTCFGKVQCEHTFHEQCIRTWLVRHRNCPICRTSGGVVGKLERKGGKDIRIFTPSVISSRIPHMMVVEAFFNRAHANLKINKVRFIQRPLNREKYDIQIVVCDKARCKSKQCSHMIASATEFVEWYQGIPMELRDPNVKFKTIVQTVLTPALRRYALHIYEHLCEVCKKEKNMRTYEYDIVKTAIS